MWKRGLKIAGAVLLAVVLVYGGYEAWDTWINYRFRTVTEGKVYRSAAMPADELAERVRDHGIRSVIDFRYESPEVAAERAALAEVGARHVHIPSTQSPPVETMDEFLAVFDDPDNYPVLVHCRHGLGRAPMYSAIYRIEHEGWDPERARRASKPITAFGSFATDEHHGQYILNWKTRQERGVDQSGDSVAADNSTVGEADAATGEAAGGGHR